MEQYPSKRFYPFGHRLVTSRCCRVYYYEKHINLTTKKIKCFYKKCIFTFFSAILMFF